MQRRPSASDLIKQLALVEEWLFRNKAGGTSSQPPAVFDSAVSKMHLALSLAGEGGAGQGDEEGGRPGRLLLHLAEQQRLMLLQPAAAAAVTLRGVCCAVRGDDSQPSTHQ